MSFRGHFFILQSYKFQIPYWQSGLVRLTHGREFRNVFFLMISKSLSKTIFLLPIFTIWYFYTKFILYLFYEFVANLPDLYQESTEKISQKEQKLKTDYRSSTFLLRRINIWCKIILKQNHVHFSWKFHVFSTINSWVFYLNLIISSLICSCRAFWGFQASQLILLFLISGFRKTYQQEWSHLLNIL